VLIKIAPDLNDQQLDHILDVALHAGVDGVIAGNTSTGRKQLTGDYMAEMGGLSGAPLAARNTAIIRHIHAQTNGNLPIIAVGGVFSAQDMAEKIAAGAILVQLYTSLVYRGPGIAGRILRNYAPD
jgi:dihydroorotate dehydrogenase